MPQTTTEPTPPPYDRAAIFDQDGPFNPSFMREATRTLLRTLPLDPDEAQGWSDRRMHAALLGLSALHPRDEIEVMIGVQALSAYHAAAACWHIGMNGQPNGNSTRHITTACTAARTFDTMLRAMERRQAKALGVPTGRPAGHTWKDAPNPTEIILALAETCRADQNTEPPEDPGNPIVWTPEQCAAVETMREAERIEKENEGLDIANTQGILPGGGMILMDHPTPQQAAYMDRRLHLVYTREIAENRRKGIFKTPKIRGIRPGDLIP